MNSRSSPRAVRRSRPPRGTRRTWTFDLGLVHGRGLSSDYDHARPVFGIARCRWRDVPSDAAASRFARSRQSSTLSLARSIQHRPRRRQARRPRAARHVTTRAPSASPPSSPTVRPSASRIGYRVGKWAERQGANRQREKVAVAFDVIEAQLVIIPADCKRRNPSNVHRKPSWPLARGIQAAATIVDRMGRRQ